MHAGIARNKARQVSPSDAHHAIICCKKSVASVMLFMSSHPKANPRQEPHLLSLNWNAHLYPRNQRGIKNLGLVNYSILWLKVLELCLKFPFFHSPISQNPINARISSMHNTLSALWLYEASLYISTMHRRRAQTQPIAPLSLSPKRNKNASKIEGLAFWGDFDKHSLNDQTPAVGAALLIVSLTRDQRDPIPVFMP